MIAGNRHGCNGSQTPEDKQEPSLRHLRLRSGTVSRYQTTWSSGKVPFRLWPGLLSSDEAIVAVLAHEVYEIEQLRPILMKGKTTIENFIAMTCPGNPGNLHDDAWEFADSLVEQMRKGPKS